MNLHKLLFISITMCLMHEVCRAQQPTPPVNSMTTDVTVDVGLSSVTVGLTGDAVVLGLTNQFSTKLLGVYGAKNRADVLIQGFCRKSGAGNENKYYELYKDGSIILRSVAFADSQIVASIVGYGQWTLVDSVLSFTKIGGDKLYVLNNGLAGTSADGGTTWAYDTAGISGGRIVDFGLDTGQNVYATDGTTLYYQTASGTSWTAVAAFPAGVLPRAVYVDRRDRIFIGTNGNGIYSSNTAGSTWTPTTAGLASVQCGKMCDDVFGNVYMIDQGGTQMLRSADGGMTWIHIDTPVISVFAPLLYGGGGTVFNDITADTVLVAATTVGRFLSSDQGHTWTMNNAGINAISLNGFYKTANGRIVETSGDGVFYLNAGDSVWHLALPTNGYGNAGNLYADTIGNIYVTGLTAGSTASMMKSSDNGTTWLPDTLGLYQITIAPSYWVDEAGNEHMANNDYSRGSTLYNKVPGGTFVPDTMGIGIPDSLYDYINTFASDHSGYLYLGASLNHAANVWRRPFAGGTWVPDTAGTHGEAFQTMICDANHNIVASLKYGFGLAYRNNGTWATMPYPTGVVGYASVTALAADNSNGVIVSFSVEDFLTNAIIGLGIYCTHDYGSTWNWVGLDSIYINQLVNEGDSTYAITASNGIYALTCAGVVGGPDAINEFPAQPGGMILYPNPANGICHIRLSTPASMRGGLTVCDVTGRSVMEMPVDAGAAEITFNTADMKEGIYFCSVKVDGESIRVRKLVVGR